jgi:site-specific DNA recombinase
VIRRIFLGLAQASRPALSRELNTEHIPGPGGRPWSDTTIRGHTLRPTGILHNEL